MLGVGGQLLSGPRGVISDNLKSLLSLGALDDLEAFIDQFTASGQCGFVADNDIGETLRALNARSDDFTVEWFDLERPSTVWYYGEAFDEGTRLEIIVVPDNLQGIPTNAERALIRAINNCEALCGPHTTNIVRRNVLVFISPLAGSDVGHLKTLFKGAFHSRQTGRSWAPKLTAVNQVWSRPPDDRQHTLIARHIADAYRRTELSTRFLALYKAHEAAYLSAVFKRLEAEFFSAPKETITTASKSLEAEVKQLISTVAERNLSTHFDKMWSTLDPLRTTNGFAGALASRLNDGGPVNVSLKETWQRGAAFIYQIRCAIVHSATGVIYENFSDADDVIEALLADMEASALALLSIDL